MLAQHRDAQNGVRIPYRGKAPDVTKTQQHSSTAKLQATTDKTHLVVMQKAGGLAHLQAEMAEPDKKLDAWREAANVDGNSQLHHVIKNKVDRLHKVTLQRSKNETISTRTDKLHEKSHTWRGDTPGRRTQFVNGQGDGKPNNRQSSQKAAPDNEIEEQML